MPVEMLGEAFGGRAGKVSVEEFDTFYIEHKEVFEDSGKKSYVAAAGIPYSFFAKQPEELQHDILVAQKQAIRGKTDHMLLLFGQQENRILFAAPETDLGWEDPKETMGISTENGWAPIRDDLSHGQIRWVYKVDGSPDEFIPAAFASVPVFYSSPMVCDIGLFRMICTNGMIAPAAVSTSKINPKNFSPAVLADFTASLVTTMKESTKGYVRFTKYLKESGANIADAEQALNTMLDLGNVVPKTLVNHTMRHLDLLKAKKEVPQLAPQEIKTQEDVANALTYYAQQLPSLGSQTKAEMGIFSYYYDAYIEAGKEQLPMPSVDTSMLEVGA